MFKKSLVVALVTVITVISLSALTDSKLSQWKPVEAARCTDQFSCKNNPSCQCYCSVKCGPRDKKSTDNPIWVQEDNLGHHCYCADRDWNLRNQCPAEKGVLDAMDVE